MSAKKKILFIIAFCFLLTALRISGGFFSDNSFVENALNIAVISLIGAAVLFIFVAASVVQKINKRLMRTFIRQKKYTEAKAVFERKAQNYIFELTKKTALFFVLTACFALNDITAAESMLFQTQWGFLRKQVKYFEILLNLKNNDLEQARINARILFSQKDGGVFGKKIAQIFACIDNNNFEDVFYSDSVYPIVKEIYYKYASKEK